VHPTAAAHRKLAVQMLAGLSALAARQPVVVTAIRYAPSTMTVSIAFRSRPGGCYVIESSTALADGWEMLEGGFASQGEATTFSSWRFLSRTICSFTCLVSVVSLERSFDSEESRKGAVPHSG
jgi:hypothetical protein